MGDFWDEEATSEAVDPVPTPTMPPPDQRPAGPDFWDRLDGGRARPAASTPARRRAPKGNTKAPDAPMRRRAVLLEATGQAHAEGDEWREQLAQGNRSAAHSALTSRAPTHNSASGFGLTP